MPDWATAIESHSASEYSDDLGGNISQATDAQRKLGLEPIVTVAPPRAGHRPLGVSAPPTSDIASQRLGSAVPTLTIAAECGHPKAQRSVVRRANLSPMKNNALSTSKCGLLRLRHKAEIRCTNSSTAGPEISVGPEYLTVARFRWIRLQERLIRCCVELQHVVDGTTVVEQPMVIATGRA